MRHQYLVAVLIVLATAGVAQSAGGFADLAFNDESADLWAGFQLGRNEEGGFVLGGRYLYSDEDNVDASVPAAIAGFSGQPKANPAIHFLLGVQWFFGEAANEDAEAIAVGGTGRWAPEQWKGVFVGGRLFYAPDVFSMGDTEGLFEWAAQGGYQINDKIRAFAEYAKITVDVDNVGDIDVDDSARIGIGFDF
jgi:hypothetical protein